jgi:hypothetical protein
MPEGEKFMPEGEIFIFRKKGQKMTKLAGGNHVEIT